MVNVSNWWCNCTGCPKMKNYVEGLICFNYQSVFYMTNQAFIMMYPAMTYLIWKSQWSLTITLYMWTLAIYCIHHDWCWNCINYPSSLLSLTWSYSAWGAHLLYSVTYTIFWCSTTCRVEHGEYWKSYCWRYNYLLHWKKLEFFCISQASHLSDHLMTNISISF